MHEHDTVRSLWVENETCGQGYLSFAGGLWILPGWRGIERTPQDVLQVLTNSIQSGSVTREEESYGRSWRRSWLQNMHSFHTFFISPTVCTQTPIQQTRVQCAFPGRTDEKLDAREKVFWKSRFLCFMQSEEFYAKLNGYLVRSFAINIEHTVEILTRTCVHLCTCVCVCEALLFIHSKFAQVFNLINL